MVLTSKHSWVRLYGNHGSGKRLRLATPTFILLYSIFIYLLLVANGIFALKFICTPDAVLGGSYHSLASTAAVLMDLTTYGLAALRGAISQPVLQPMLLPGGWNR